MSGTFLISLFNPIAFWQVLKITFAAFLAFS